jgi:Beta-L-arabinofuranosidase, GH127
MNSDSYQKFSPQSMTRRKAIGMSLSALIVTALRATGATPPQPLMAAEGATSADTLSPLLYASSATLGGRMGDAFNQSVARLALPPYSLEWLRSDISFEQDRVFTAFSGDVSGRFLEIASLTSDPLQPSPATLPGMLATVTKYQKADGHFGADVDWTNTKQVMTTGTPILWGNARMLVGLVTAYERFQDPKILESAKKLGDFYLATADTLCDPKRQQEFHASTGYATGFDTCYFPAIESLMRLYWLTKDDRYLKLSERIAPLFYEWDHLPLPHTHGNLCAQYGLLHLYEATGDASYLAHVESRWKETVSGGYVAPTGGVGEKFALNSERDEGCAECDWLRLTLRLWALTGKPEYLNMADREIHNEYLANRFPDGGFGHRFIESDSTGVRALGKHSEEAVWCCVFHGTLGLHLLKSYVAVGAEDGIYLNFPLEPSQTFTASGQPWKFSITNSSPAKPGSLAVAVHVEPAQADEKKSTHLFVRVPDWATSVQVADANGSEMKTSAVNDHLLDVGALSGPHDLVVTFNKTLRVEDRRLNPVQAKPGEVSFLHDVVLRDGPNVLYVNDTLSSALLLAHIDGEGNVKLDSKDTGQFSAVLLPAATRTKKDAVTAAQTAPSLTLGHYDSFPDSDRKLFVFDLLVVPV